MKQIIICLFFLLLSTANFAQDALKKADQAFEANEYSFAINYYKSIFAKVDHDDETKARIAYNIGYCNKKISKPLDAQLWFEKAIDLRYQNPEIYFNYAEVLRMNEQFDKAIENYNKYKLLIPRDTRADKGIESCKIARTWLKDPSEYIVTNLVYLNTEFIDYSPYFISDGNKNILYFSTSRPGAEGDKTHGGSGESFSDIFVSTEDAKGAWSFPSSLSNEINTTNDEGTPSVPGNLKSMYFTQCNFEENISSSCRVMESKKDGKNWSKPDVVNLSDHKKDTSDFVHPSISKNGLALYFSSNRSGGYGGYDIWVTTRSSLESNWSSPKNAGSVVNTAGDEVFPYIRNDSILYFSSNGHVGMGGLDIFRLNKDAKGREYVLNMLSPINSTSDDYGITFKGGLYEEGYFSSNRPKGSIGYDDIYHFTLPILTYNISGKIMNEMTDAFIPYANVRLIGSDGSSVEVFSDKDGNYAFNINPQTNYVIIAIHDGFLNSKYKISTYGLQKDKSFDVNIYMTQIDMPVEIPNIMYDVNRWELRPESVVALEKLLDILKDNPHIIIELSSHTDYRQGRISNEELSQFRAQSVVNFLIAKGIDPKRLIAKGYAASKPKVIDLKYSEIYSFLKLGDVLTPEFIENLPATQRETCHQINRRTEFRVLATDFH